MDHVVAGGADNDSIFEGGHDDLPNDMYGGDDGDVNGGYDGDVNGGNDGDHNMYGGDADQDMYGGGGDEGRNGYAEADATYSGVDPDELTLIKKYFGDGSPLVGALNRISDTLQDCLDKMNGEAPRRRHKPNEPDETL